MCHSFPLRGLVAAPTVLGLTPMARPKRKLVAPLLPMQRQFAFTEQGRFFDLRRIFDKINATYFANRIRGYTILWGRRRKQRPLSSIVFGSIQEEDRVIRIHPLLDQKFVPTWFLEYVVFHEMLHAVVPDQYDQQGRRLVHHEEFVEREQQFRWYRRAKRWEQENLARFLR